MAEFRKFSEILWGDLCRRFPTIIREELASRPIYTVYSGHLPYLQPSPGTSILAILNTASGELTPQPHSEQ